MEPRSTDDSRRANLQALPGGDSGLLSAIVCSVSSLGTLVRFATACRAFRDAVLNNGRACQFWAERVSRSPLHSVQLPGQRALDAAKWASQLNLSGSWRQET